MAKINAESFHRFLTGEIVDGDNSPTGANLNPILQQIVAAQNDTYDRLVKKVVIQDATSAIKSQTNFDAVNSSITFKEGTNVQFELNPVTGVLTISATNETEVIQQPTFLNVAVSGQPTIVANNPTDTLSLVGGTGISLTTNPITDEITITATSEATPGAHASSHITGGADVIPNAVSGGASGLMSGADKAFLDTVAAQITLSRTYAP